MDEASLALRAVECGEDLAEERTHVVDLRRQVDGNKS
jgi:hypothetical protein